jgi:hypothetical protein
MSSPTRCSLCAAFTSPVSAPVTGVALHWPETRNSPSPATVYLCSHCKGLLINSPRLTTYDDENKSPENPEITLHKVS